MHKQLTRGSVLWVSRVSVGNRHSSRPARPVHRPFAEPLYVNVGLLVLGLLLPLQMKVIGVLYAGEVILLLCSLLAIFCAGNQLPGRRWVRLLLVGVLVTALGYILSDVIARSPLNNALRGAGRVALVGSNLLGTWYATRSMSRRVLLVCVGYGASHALLLGAGFYDDLSMSIAWKWFVAGPLTVGALALAALWAKDRIILFSIFALAIGLGQILIDCRAIGILCIAAAGVQCGRYLRYSHRTVIGNAAFIFVTGMALSMAAYIYFFTNSDFAQRRQDSDSWRTAAIITTLQAIKESPFLGRGSWTEPTDLANAVEGRRRELGGSGTEQATDFAAHSQILQTWFEGGILGVAFPLVWGTFLARALLGSLRDKPCVHGIVSTYLILDSLFALALSPFNGQHRLDIAVTVSAGLSILAPAIKQEKARVLQRLRLH